MNLPKIVFRLSSIVLQKKQVALTTNHEQRITNNEWGFAPIALVVLLLFGIAAGTLLIQNRTNFLPQAAEFQPATITNEQVGVSCRSDRQPAYYCQTPLNGGWSCNREDNHGCNYGGDKKRADKVCLRSVDSITAGKSGDDCYKVVCNDPNYPTLELVSNQWVCYPPAQICEYEEKSEEYGDCARNGGQRCYNLYYKSDETNCQWAPLGNPHYVCFPDAQCNSDQQPPAPAGNPIVSRSCTNNVASNTRADGTTKTEDCKQSGTYCREFSGNNGLVAICGIPQSDAECKQAYGNNYILDKSTAHICAPADQAAAPVPARTGPEIPAKKCNLTCTAPSLGCFEIEGKERCVFPTANALSCPQSETDWCKAPPDVRDGCEVAQAVIVDGQTKNDIKFTRCTAPKAGAPATNPGGPGPAKGTPPVAPTVPGGAPGSRAAVPGAAPATPIITNCGKNADGRDIPCYQIGVFNDEQTLASTEAGAKLASERYTQYEEIMGKINSKLSDEIRRTAAEKLKAAQDAAEKCLAGG